MYSIGRGKGAGAMAEAAILEQCRLNPEGIPDAELAEKISHIAVVERARAINALLSARKLQIFKDGDTIVYREVKQDEAVKCVSRLAKTASRVSLPSRRVRTAGPPPFRVTRGRSRRRRVERRLDASKTPTSFKIPHPYAPPTASLPRARFKGLSSEDLLVYQIIQAAGNTGIWTKELKQKSNLPQTQISKIFKTLEARKLIKHVKHVAQQNRKVYMLYELEPSREITGGAWYTEHEYDAEFINVLRDQCVKFIMHKKRATLDDVCDFVSASKLSQVELGQEEVLQIVNTLVYDGKVDAIEEFGDEEYDPEGDDWEGDVLVVYTPASLPIPETSAFTSVPCGVCPVFSECTPGGLVSPETCEYMKEWLSF